ncbi:hypothetical protein DFAR_3340002 [Desulfarculales bacterium]
MLRWIRKATSVRTAQWRITHFTPPCPEVHSARHQNPGPGPQGAHDSGRACSPDPKPLDLQPFQRPLGGA